MIRLGTIALLMAGLTSVAAADPGQSSPDKVRSTQDFKDIQREVETLRGKTFLREVPVYKISEKELRAIADRELEKDLPGAKLHDYEKLLGWLDVVPPDTDLKAVYGDFLVDQVAGLYDSDTKEMCIPGISTATTNLEKKAAEKKLDALSSQMDEIVLAHEFTHALEDQYWPIDDPRDHDFKASTDRGTAHSYLAEGSATRAMVEAIPAQMSEGSPRTYFLLWNALHSHVGEFAINYELGGVWKGKDALVAGVPDTIARTEAMPYSFGYAFCTGIMRDWGLDGLDYIYEHPPVSSSQVMHPVKCWQWRDLPVRIDVPEILPGGWNQISSDSVGEAGIAVLLGCQLKSLNHGLDAARGWDGDHVVLFENTNGHRLFVWASSWDSEYAAGRYVNTWLQEREKVHHATVTRKEGDRVQWQSPDGRTGLILRARKHVCVVETDDREGLENTKRLMGAISFTEPSEDAARAAKNSFLRRYNPFVSWQRDGRYTVTRSLGGLLSRHDRNSVGGADSILLGLAGESRRTPSFHKWQLGGGLLVKHESEVRRGFSKTTLLPWGVLAAHCSAKLPQSPENIISRSSLLWGLCGSTSKNGAGRRTVHVLPFGLLYRGTHGSQESSVHVLGTGVSRDGAADDSSPTRRYHLFGIQIWTTRPTPRKQQPPV